MRKGLSYFASGVPGDTCYSFEPISRERAGEAEEHVLSDCGKSGLSLNNSSEGSAETLNSNGSEQHC